MNKLKITYSKQILKDPELQGAIAKATGRSVQTIERWARSNDEKLSMLSSVNAIRKYLQLPESENLLMEPQLQTA